MIRIMKNKLKRVRDFLYLLVFCFRLRRAPAEVVVKKTAFVFGVSPWKQPYIHGFLHEYDNTYFVPSKKVTRLVDLAIKRYSNRALMVWGTELEDKIRVYAEDHRNPLFVIEDGFVRSIGLGSMHAPPYSICVDSRGIYYDSTRPSDLEDLLNDYDFQADPYLLHRAKSCMEQLLNRRLSKYNHVAKKNPETIYGRKSKPRILVIGQVEDDASIRKGSHRLWTNLELVRCACEDHPEAEVLYKPHPDVLTKRRPSRSNMELIRSMAVVIEEPLHLGDAFQTIDHVYTITSLSGFEALMRGITVTTLGAPFYSGWGLTDDRQRISRRRRRLTIEELFAGAYLLYPRYRDPDTGQSLTLEETIHRLARNTT